MALIDSSKCQDAPDSTPSNAGVAGTGILLSFMIAALVSLVLSASVIFSEMRRRPGTSTIRRKLLNGYSDSQILQGIGLQCVGLAQVASLVPYHFFLIWMQSLLSMAVHNATLLALARDYRRDWVVRWLRQLLMFVNLALSSASGVFVLRAVSRGLDKETLPIACAWDPSADSGSGSAPPDAGLSYVGTIVAMAGNVVIFGLATWYLHGAQRVRRPRLHKAIQIGGLLLMSAIAIGAAVRVVLLSQAFGTPSIQLSDHGETDWSFGQLLSLLVLVFPLVTVVEIARGEVTVADSPDDDAYGDEAHQRIYDSELQENVSSKLSHFSKS